MASTTKIFILLRLEIRLRSSVTSNNHVRQHLIRLHSVDGLKETDGCRDKNVRLYWMKTELYGLIKAIP